MTINIYSIIKITRAYAIIRIIEVNQLIIKKNYKGLNYITCERDINLFEFIDSFDCNEIKDVNLFSNKILEDNINSPFFRLSVFYYYNIV